MCSRKSPRAQKQYTLAGSVYKGRVTRVLPGMQSAFVDIGLERDAFLYVSDFMELEEHDEDLTDSIPANRGVQDLRAQPEQAAMPQEMPHFEHAEGASPGESEAMFEQPSDAIQRDAAASPMVRRMWRKTRPTVRNAIAEDIADAAAVEVDGAMDVAKDAIGIGISHCAAADRSLRCGRPRRSSSSS